MTACSTPDDGEKKPAKTLDKVLGQSERAKELVEGAAQELASANVVLKQELPDLAPPPEVERAIEQSAVAEAKVMEASEELAAVNDALEHEIDERRVLEFQYAAATEQKDAARHDALHDPLTGLPNRALFNDRLEHGLAQAKRHGWNLAVMFVDLDRFKEVNDSYGHGAGDILLRTIARRLKDNTRSDDTIGRQGGDEFLYLLNEIRDEADVGAIAGQIIEAIQAPCKISVNDVDISPTIRASIGIAIYPKDGDTADSLVRCADAAMYRAKQSKCGYVFAG